MCVVMSFRSVLLTNLARIQPGRPSHNQRNRRYDSAEARSDRRIRHFGSLGSRKHSVRCRLGTSSTPRPATSVKLTSISLQAALDAHGKIDKREQYGLVTANLEKLMGVEGWIGDDGDLVIYQGGDAFNMSSKVIAIASPRKGSVEFF